jgi:hypothetical protein
MCFRHMTSCRHPPSTIIFPILTTRWKRIFSSRGHEPPGLSGRLVGSKPVERSPKPGEDRFSVSKFWAFQHVYQKFPLDIMSDISHKNCIGRLTIFGCCGGGIQLATAHNLNFFYFSRFKASSYHFCFRRLLSFVMFRLIQCRSFRILGTAVSRLTAPTSIDSVRHKEEAIMAVKIVVKKSEKKLYVYRSGSSSPIYTATAIHGGPTRTTTGRRTIKRWVWGAVSFRYEPNTWFSFGATFKDWPGVGTHGSVKRDGKNWPVYRMAVNKGKIWYNSNNGYRTTPKPLSDPGWFLIWKDQNPFGVVMADLNPGTIELHGTGKNEAGEDVFPPVTHGCVRTNNAAIRKIKSLAPVGSVVEILP